MCLSAPAAAAASMGIEGELQETDVLWPIHDHDHHSPDDERPQPRCWPGPGSRKRLPCPCVGGAAARGGSSSAPAVPIAIPVAVAAARSWEPSASSWRQNDDEEAAFVPPHVVLAARRRCRDRESEGRAASSVCVGLGRTLKGRDLQSVRTAVLRMTGFIET
ncbi:hypothetical protein BS78_09G204900 [Paspalum vaginatum]|nr:hypothetical protein BS78_09G204900 [Paspalum vaginatum]